MKKAFHFTENEKQQIKNAVEELEKVSSGELVPYFVYSSDNYMESCWKSSIVLGVLALITVSLMSYLWLLPDWVTPIDSSLFVFTFLFIGFIIPFLSHRIRAVLADDDYVLNRVFQHAQAAFLSEGVYKTVDKTGILIFISYIEHEVIVIGDEGINAKVSKEDWDDVVNSVINGIKTKKVADGIVKAIDKCKTLLLDNGFHVRNDDTNELSDHLRI